MFLLILGVVCICVLNGYILIEEELLILLASIFWVDAGSKFIKNMLVNELVHKSIILKKKYKWFFRRKWVFDDIVIRAYYVRIMRYYRLRRETWQFIEQELLENFLIYIVENNILLQKYQLNIELFTMGILCVKDLVNKRFEVLNNILSENLLFPKTYTTSEYINLEIANVNTVVILTV